MKEYLATWNKTNGERVKLQYAYAALAIALLVVAGLVGLLNDQLGIMIVQIAFAFTVIFFVNAIAWVMLDAFVLRRLGTSRTTKK